MSKTGQVHAVQAIYIDDLCVKTFVQFFLFPTTEYVLKWYLGVIHMIVRGRVACIVGSDMPKQFQWFECVASFCGECKEKHSSILIKSNRRANKMIVHKGKSQQIKVVSKPFRVLYWQNASVGWKLGFRTCIKSWGDFFSHDGMKE